MKRAKEMERWRAEVIVRERKERKGKEGNDEG